MSAELNIGGKIINENSDAFVIAEIGHNHQGDLNKCFQLIKTAKDCGCDAVKLQKRNNKKLFTEALYNSSYENENSFGKTYGEHREFLEFGYKEYESIKKYCEHLDIIFFATPFDEESAEFLQCIDIPCFKICSADIRNIPLLKCVARFDKPILLSTGGVTISDVDRAWKAIFPINEQICLMQCTASYPVLDFAEMNLKVIENYKYRYNCITGLSAHDAGIAMAIAAYCIGARVIEKHFTLHRAWKGTDHSFSLETSGMRRMVRDLRRVKQAMGDGIKKIYPCEEKAIYKMGKGLYAARELIAGTKLQAEDIIIKSPRAEMDPYEIDLLIGQTLIQDMKKEEPFSRNNINLPS